jgi:hypothetical protein
MFPPFSNQILYKLEMHPVVKQLTTGIDNYPSIHKPSVGIEISYKYTTKYIS